jgi:hypothetical protein
VPEEREQLNAWAERRRALGSLVALVGSVDELRRAVAAFPWDCDHDLVTLTRRDVVNVLNRYLAAQLTAKDVNEWADALEGREDVGLEQGYEDILHRALFELATPEINEAITASFIRRWIAALQA